MFFFVGNYKNDHDDTRWEFSLVLARGDGRGKAGRRSWCWQKMVKNGVEKRNFSTKIKSAIDIKQR